MLQRAQVMPYLPIFERLEPADVGNFCPIKDLNVNCIINQSAKHFSPFVSDNNKICLQSTFLYKVQSASQGINTSYSLNQSKQEAEMKSKENEIISKNGKDPSKIYRTVLIRHTASPPGPHLLMLEDAQAHDVLTGW